MKSMMDNKEQQKKVRDKIVKGLEETYRRLVIYKKQINSPLVVIRDGKVTELDPFEVPPTTVYKRNGAE